jgi:uncharacterized protein YndB with AHSA1/START domain
VKWFGPEEIETLSAQADARVGGRFRIIMRDVSGEEHGVSGIYREVVPNEKVVFTWAWRSTPERESLVIVSIKRDGAGSLEQFFDEAARDRHDHGWLGCLNKLERYLS